MDASIENHGMCPVHLQAASVVGSLLSVTEVPSEDLPQLSKHLESVRHMHDRVNFALCNM